MKRSHFLASLAGLFSLPFFKAKAAPVVDGVPLKVVGAKSNWIMWQSGVPHFTILEADGRKYSVTMETRPMMFSSGIENVTGYTNADGKFVVVWGRKDL